MIRFASLVFRAILRILPRSFRDDYGDEAVSLYVQMVREARVREGRWGAVRTAFEGWTGIIKGWLEERTEGAGLDHDGASTPGAGRLGGLTIDLRHGLRALRSRPIATATVIGTLALGIGATTAVFSVVNGVLLTPLPYPDADRLVRVWQTRADWANSPNRHLRSFANEFPLSYPTARDWETADWGIEAMGAYTGSRLVHQTADASEILRGQHLTAGMVPTLGIQALIGRTLLPEDDVVGAPRVAVLHHGLWRDRYNEDPAVLGTTLNLDGDPHTIVGVMPPHYRPLFADAVISTPMPEESKVDGRDSQYLNVIARLAPGVSLESASRRLGAVQETLAQRYPDEQEGLGARMVSMLDSIVGEVRSTLWLLFAAVGLVLLIASANIASILSVWGLARGREMAVKAAMGASTPRLVRGLLLEAGILAGVGGLLGAGIARLSMPLLLRWVPPDIPRHSEMGMDLGVLMFGLGATLLTTVLVGVLPAIQAARTSPGLALRGAGRHATDTRLGARARQTLVVAEVALAFVLLFAAGLLGTSFHRLWSAERGFNTENLIVLQTTPDPLVYPESEDEDRFVAELRSALEAIPGVEVSASNQVSLAGSLSQTSYHVERDGQEPEEVSVTINVMLENYLDVMGIPLLEGRGLASTDREDAPLVAVVNQALADALWPNESPLGKRMRSREDEPWTTVVGVAGNVRHTGLAAPADPQLYVPVWQNHRHPDQWLLRATGPVESIFELARSAVRSVSPSTPVRDIDILEERIASSVAVPRFRTFFIVGLAAMAGLLALIGVYGVITFSVAQRTREIGVRMALGAQAGQVVRSVLASGFRLAGGGILLGVIGALLIAGTLSDFLFEIRPRDPRAYAAVALGVLAIAGLATYLPARRAARIDPMQVLTSD